MKRLQRFARSPVTLIVFAGCLAFAAKVIASDPTTPPSEQLGLTIPMRDSVRLALDLFLPGESGRWPTILVRTPYGRKKPYTASYRNFAQHGYAVVIQDVRGRFASQGVFGTTLQEGNDGNDTLNWIARQPWSNGRVGMAGSSYQALAQWWAAVQRNPHLQAISPITSGDDEYLDRYYSRGGALQLGHRLLWLAENRTPSFRLKPLFASYIDHLPLTDADVLAAGAVLEDWRMAVSHPTYDDYWRRLSIREKMPVVTAPVLSWAGWFDEYAESDLDAFSLLARQGKSIETWVGPWAHDLGLHFTTVDFGPSADLPIRNIQLHWFDHALKDTHDAPEPRPGTLHLFVMGANVWREEHEWPLSRAKSMSLYLVSNGHANSTGGDGHLRWPADEAVPTADTDSQPTSSASQDSFTYDPRYPVPTQGGAICCEAAILPPGPLNQKIIEGRDDVLVFTSAPLREDLEATGRVQAVLYVSTSANDTDFTVKLVDVQPDGKPISVTDGIQRLRYRLSLVKPSFVKRNTPYQIAVNVGVTSYVFARGHSVRVEISSSNFPRYDRNLNSAKPVALETKMVKARQTIYHDAEYPSEIILPVISNHVLPGGAIHRGSRHRAGRTQ